LPPFRSEPFVFSSACETWSLTLREEYTLRVFQNRALRRIFGPKKNEIIGRWRKLHNKKLHNLYSLPNKIRIMKSWRIRWAGNVVHMEQKRNAYKVLVGKPERNRPLERRRHKWEDNKMDLREVGWGGMNWINLARDRDQ
jgi:hypothetical protein